MTVKELIAALQTCDPDAEVRVDDSSFSPAFPQAWISTESGNVLLSSGYDYSDFRYRRLEEK